MEAKQLQTGIQNAVEDLAFGNRLPGHLARRTGNWRQYVHYTMSQDGSQALRNANNVYSSVHSFVKAVDRGLASDIAVKVRLVECALDQLKEAIDSIPDISSSEDYQLASIASLKKEIAAKDAFIATCKHGGLGTSK